MDDTIEMNRQEVNQEHADVLIQMINLNTYRDCRDMVALYSDLTLALALCELKVETTIFHQLLFYIEQSLGNF